MKKKTSLLISLMVILTLALSACNYPLQTGMIASGSTAETETEAKPAEDHTPDETKTPTETEPAAAEPTKATESPAPEPTAEPGLLTVGPTDFPENINPLTGLPVAAPSLLALPPALISVSNFPASARPQAGLNTSPFVFEMTIGEGMTRFLALFYGAYPQTVSGQTEGQTSGSTGGATNSDGSGSPSGETTSDVAGAAGSASIGPIRSGRLPYEDIRSLFSGFLVMASAYSGVAQNLNQTTSIYGSDSDDINSAMIGVSQLYDIALSRAEGYPGSNFDLTGLKFSPTPPEGGLPADVAWVFYSNLNQIQWRYTAERGGYIRYDIQTDGSNEFVMATDRLTGDPILRENVIVIFATHNYLAPTLIDINLTNIPPMKALLFRDGAVHEIFWTTRFGDYEKETGLTRPIRFVDANGDPVALKNGQTWVEIVSTASFYVESEISDHPFFPIKEAEGTGLWLVRYKGKY